MENGQSFFFFFLSPHLPYVFGHVRLTPFALTLLLPYSKPILKKKKKKKKKKRLFCSLIIMQIEENVITASEISIILHIITQKLMLSLSLLQSILLLFHNSLKIFLDKLTSSLTLSSKTLAYFFTRFSDIDGCFIYLFFFRLCLAYILIK